MTIMTAVGQSRAALQDATATAQSLVWNVPITSASATNGLDSATAGVMSARAAVASAYKQLDASKAVLTQAQANAEKSDADLNRYAELIVKDDISHQQYDSALADSKANQAKVVAAQAQAESGAQQVLEAQAKLKQMEAELRSAHTAPEQIAFNQARRDAAKAQAGERQAQLDQALLNLSYTVIRAPATGIIGKKSVEVGQNVNIGQELLDVVPLADIWVTANFKETQLAHMSSGNAVQIKIDAYGKHWTGHVTNLGGGTGSVFSLLPPENATGNYVKVVQRIPIRIDFDRDADGSFNADGLLKPGLSVEPEVRIK